MLGYAIGSIPVKMFTVMSSTQGGNDSFYYRIFFWKFSRSNRELVVGSISSNL